MPPIGAHPQKRYPPEEQDETSKSGDNFAAGMGCLLLLGILYFPAIFIVPHFTPDKTELDSSAAARDAMTKTLSLSFQTDDIQVKQLGAFNLEVWIAKTNFESVSYLNRKSLLESVGKGWCDGFGGWSCPTIAVRDEKTGKELASYHCLFRYVTIE